ncbi:D-3-phosphoglycerate dehydrogenase (plasmid) [Roseomonas mucosa]|uniref:phosphoglycerate dehydrogenase n=1 Tax=Roseomonas mucosa TaxID=207340 RepID=UPI00220EAFAB|nr:phosphoglycerate dehydrogenase [Roseomonas mucosa]QDJ12219.1 D-3-phosphoglycerate dehydrogenase [Roseomonas mucosa]
MTAVTMTGRPFSYPKERICILLLEGIHPNAVSEFERCGYAAVEQLPGAPDEDTLIRRLEGVHLLGIRSRTQLTRRVLEAADRLIAVGCFCIGTDQVDLEAARDLGIPVFNAPHASTRSVAEMVMGEIIVLMRRLFEANAATHRGEWLKSAAGSWEIRGKTLGIVGYGNIGTQLGLMAESLGMDVAFYDTATKLPLGKARRATSLHELLGAAQVVSLHVPDLPSTRGMIGAGELAVMPPGSYLVNTSRGHVVDIESLAAALRDQRLAGAAVDVFPREPKSAAERFESPLRGLPNTILTPHIAASTAEAQARIGDEVAQKLVAYSDVGDTTGAVNFPEVALPLRPGGGVRFMHVHRNAPGVLGQIVAAFSTRGININAQYLATQEAVGYVVVDADADAAQAECLAELRLLEGAIRARTILDRG